MPSRRDFLKTSAAVGGSVLVGAGAPGLLAAAAPAPARAPMRILVLGGTGFIGPHLVKHAVARGHKVTIFTRGRSDDSMLPAEVERLAAIAPAPRKLLTAHNVAASDPHFLAALRDAVRKVASGAVAGTRDGTLVTYEFDGFSIQLPVQKAPTGQHNR